MFIVNFFFLPFIFCALKHSVAKIASRYLMQPKYILKENTIKSASEIEGSDYYNRKMIG